ncbi:FkbM family methyltransferase [Herbaspirillum sp. RTI4]|uniref:FkbM family methyltransferase n=1 Tax=Herbaspirillum sp. RTI4 TaxID=3048640 RepID=UPI002AB4D664|nr:FkbM family methyltransferase [Herbaspirillum sp. RTI4]MDY7577029.1 FkbM family methyltransferase [Herbaspirillum sp. RTI4]MEA9983100.1 FkbM family methyltransferase [Herbaspirillum sp. RTI4]
MSLNSFDTLLEFLAAYPDQHARGTPFYRFVDSLVKEAFHEAQPAFAAGQPVPMAEFGMLTLPYEKMGAIDSIDLFGLDELLMFAFYYRNKGRYARAADIGANLGLHTILLSMSGCKVEAFEPDPEHHEKLLRNLKLNNITDAIAHKAAVSEQNGQMQFVRVLGNTTSSHLAGAKANPYGELDKFDVNVMDIREIVQRVDLMKIDAEGHEAVILHAIPIADWNHVDAFVEVGTPENALAVFNTFAGTQVNIFAQKSGWKRVENLAGMPISYKEGGIFISAKTEMPW